MAFYSLLCERLFGRRPARVQLLYLADPVAIIATPTDRSTRGVERKLAAVWTAVERACEREDFRPNPSRLCDWCGFKAYCPSFGGDDRPRRRPPRAARARRLSRPCHPLPCRRAARSRSKAVVAVRRRGRRRLDRVRGNRVLDRVMYGASELGDWSLDLAPRSAPVQALLPGRDPMTAVRLSAILGVESLLVNGGIKSCSGAPGRCGVDDRPRPHRLRTPRSSSFPSGHASAAFTAAGVLSARATACGRCTTRVAVVVASQPGATCGSTTRPTSSPAPPLGVGLAARGQPASGPSPELSAGGMPAGRAAVGTPVRPTRPASLLP